MVELHSKHEAVVEGCSLKEATLVFIMVHGRGGSAADILSLKQFFDHPKIHFRAPQADNSTWYPNSFLAPLNQNEPWISAALKRLGNELDVVCEHLPVKKVILLGFSQGACLALEFAARNAQEYAGIFAFSGGLPAEKIHTENYMGNFMKTPVFFGCSDIDPHIPKDRVNQSAEVYEQMGANVTKKIYKNMPHTIIQDEIEAVKKTVDKLLA